ncbi:major capsid protein [Acidovorax sp. LjRoot129]|uniref:major capsid protein n=1 Tax=Acidovorax sp. LjRoot129 TaxID=3342260 RepID=UPI003ECDBC74
MNRFNTQTRRLATAAAAGALVLATNMAHAAIDVTGVVAEIDDTIAPIGLIGAAVLLVVVAVAAFKWVRRAIS